MRRPAAAGMALTCSQLPGRQPMQESRRSQKPTPRSYLRVQARSVDHQLGCELRTLPAVHIHHLEALEAGGQPHHGAALHARVEGGGAARRLILAVQLCHEAAGWQGGRAVGLRGCEQMCVWVGEWVGGQCTSPAAARGFDPPPHSRPCPCAPMAVHDACGWRKQGGAAAHSGLQLCCLCAGERPQVGDAVGLGPPAQRLQRLQLRAGIASWCESVCLAC